MNKENLQIDIKATERAITQRLAWISKTQEEEILMHHRAALRNLRRLKAEAELELKKRRRA